MKMMQSYAYHGHTCSRPAYAALYLAGAVLALPEGSDSAFHNRPIRIVVDWLYARLKDLCGGAMVEGYDRMANHFARKAYQAAKAA